VLVDDKQARFTLKQKPKNNKKAAHRGRCAAFGVSGPG